jgi:hypothetical protein
MPASCSMPWSKRYMTVDPFRAVVWFITAIAAFKLDSYQPPYPVTGFAQARLVMEAMRSGICMSLFHALWHASRMAS